MAFNKRNETAPANDRRKSNQQTPSGKVWLNADLENMVFCKCMKHDHTENSYYANVLFCTTKDFRDKEAKFINVTMFGGMAFFAAEKMKKGDVASFRIWFEAKKHEETGNWYNSINASGLKTKGYDKDGADDALWDAKNEIEETQGDEPRSKAQEQTDDLPF
jgi:hypothetical protein